MDAQTAKKEIIKKKSNPLRVVIKIAGNAVFAICLLLIVFLVFSMVQSKISGGPPAIAGYQMYIVAGGSMSPTFEAGSLAFLEQVQPQEVRAGDILTFRIEGSDGVNTHRVMDVQNESGQISYTTRGDANDVNDGSPVLAQNVIGKVAYTVPYVGILMNFAQSKIGLLMLIIIPGVLLIFLELKSLIKYLKEEKKRKTGEAARADDLKAL